MPESTLTQCFTDLIGSLRECGLKSPVSIELAGKEEAVKVVREIEPAGWLADSVTCKSIVRDIESGKMQSFSLFNIEFWWRPGPAVIEFQQGLRATA